MLERFEFLVYCLWLAFVWDAPSVHALSEVDSIRTPCGALRKVTAVKMLDIYWLNNFEIK